MKQDEWKQAKQGIKAMSYNVHDDEARRAGSAGSSRGTNNVSYVTHH